ncbi:MAG: Ig-like domain-containing protein [Ignavibacteriales bacterium]|nr:Ig-like domain-containing protein [Ignavibacteriales bacterium]
MKNIREIFSALFFVSVLIAVTGCKKQSTTPTEVSTVPATNISLVPVDNQTSVQLNQGIIVDFAKSVDVSVVENNFHLISQKDMADSTCPIGAMMNHTDMAMAMMDSMKMRHLDSIHSTKGKMVWSNNNKTLTFTPESLMQPKMQYMVHIGKQVMQMMQTVGNMSGHSNAQMMDDMMIHFTTMDTTSTTGGGHLGHH